MLKIVELKLKGSLELGITVDLKIENQPNNLNHHNHKIMIEEEGKLPPNLNLLNQLQQHWQIYHQFMTANCRAIKTGKITVKPSSNSCHESRQNLQQQFNNWLKSDEFRVIEKTLLTELNREDEIKFSIRTHDPLLKKLPWQIWELLDSYPYAEITFNKIGGKYVLKNQPKPKIKILAVLGDNEGIDIEKDRQMLTNLPQVDAHFLNQPKRQEFYDKLREQPWDIFFFAGHSNSILAEDQDNITQKDTGMININSEESLTIDEFWLALKKAVDNGLKLAILNSCDGVGIAQKLNDSSIPQMIVMREVVPDPVAQEFLKYFLKAFSEGKSFHLAFKEARESLECLEHQYPCATWLPIIYQNPYTDLTWHDLYNNNQTENLTKSSQQETKNQQINQINLPNFLSFKNKRQLIKLGIILLLGGIVWHFILPLLFTQIGLCKYQKEKVNLSEAQFYYEKAIFFNPNFAPAYYNLGLIYEDNSRFDEAIQYYQMAQKKGNIPRNNNNLARLYIWRFKKYEDARILLVNTLNTQEFTEDTEDQKVLSNIKKNLGWAELELKNYEDAKKHLQEAIKINPENGSAYCLLTQIKSTEANMSFNEVKNELQKCYDLTSAKYNVNKIMTNPEAIEWKRCAKLQLEKQSISLDSSDNCY